MPTAGIEYDAHGRPMRVRRTNKDKDRDRDKDKDKDNRSLISSTSSRKHRDSSASSSRTPVPLDSSAQPSEYTPPNANLDQLPDVKDNRSVISSSSSRRYRDPSASSSRTPVPPDSSTQTSDFGQQNVNLDQLPELPESGPDSPSSATSPMNRTVSNMSTSATLVSPTMQHLLPASMQPYLAPYCESVVDLSDPVSSQPTLRAEKSKEPVEVKSAELKSAEVKAADAKPADAKPNPPKTSSLASSSDTPTAFRKSSPESVKSALSVVSSQPASSGRDQQKKKPASLKSEDSKQDSRLKVPASALLPYGVGPSGEQFYYSPQYGYLPTHQAIAPPPVQHAPTSQALSHYSEYGPPSGHHPQQTMLPEAPQPPPSTYQGQWDRGPVPIGGRPDDSTMALFHRISCAIPDFHALMSLHHETCGILEASQLHIRDQEAHGAAEARQFEIRIAQMETDLDSMTKKSSAEITRLKLDTRNLENRCKELQHRLTAGGKHNEALQAANETLRAEQKEAGRKYQEYEAALNEAFRRDKDRMIVEQRTNQRAMQDELQAHTRIADANLSKRLAEERRAYEEETQTLETRWARQRRELEDRQANFRRDLEDTLEAKQKVVDEERRTYLQAREGWDKERESLTRKWEEERSLLQKASEEQRKALMIQYQREKDSILKQSSQSRNSSEAEDYVLGLQREIERLKAGWDADSFRFQKATADFKTTARTLNEQNTKLQKLTEAFGHGRPPTPR
ncbi:MAG: hypothetical protein ALECFALPRED_004851 [Alectoria fallacina]|uniref:Uncharacterized protein n=1 Tax=Alectoria fallacina TaxID=1903189 RepID=A0A8H3EF82_9LECA|nr:MAG: hypothetical protein ALECFALPRED_004851 [Alectoria fallacina]